MIYWSSLEENRHTDQHRLAKSVKILKERLPALRNWPSHTPNIFLVAGSGDTDSLTGVPSTYYCCYISCQRRRVQSARFPFLRYAVASAGSADIVPVAIVKWIGSSTFLLPTYSICAAATASGDEENIERKKKQPAGSPGS